MSGTTHLIAMTNGPLPHETAAPADVRYAEAEVTMILRLATEGDSTVGRSVLSAPEVSRQGLALADLHRIGEEVGIAPDRLTAAARQVDAERMVTQRVDTNSLELTTSFQLAEAPSEETWGRIVAVLRDVFEDSGVVTHEGSLRRWRSKDYEQQDVSRIEVRLEPDPYGTGWRLLLASRAVDHTMSVGGVLAGLGVVIAAIPLVTGLPSRFSVLGALVVGCGALVCAGGYRWRDTWRQRRTQHFRAAVAGLCRLGLSGAPVARD
ncbi:hypothetical protein [Gemmatimonas sp.]|jgi:hypothetical protein|uniref:hypothetical protein n=1 Tax=Gemmatimonas sp. TaxID=1962908 RepID=UPI0022C70554|nr:hypothetical protein [Gemmatimonas sp.]MCZ8206204.1 hypothetical protein [Gemmatimonas sp.]